MSVARWLETDSLSNQNIASAAAIGAYTADADRMIVVDVSLDQVAGNGDYVIYVTRQINGAGSAYVMLPKTTCAAASGETAIAMQSGMISVRSGDVLTVYVDGLAGDTATPDTVVRIFEVAALQPTDAGRTLDILATGEASANVTYSAGVALAGRLAEYADVSPLALEATAQAILEDTGTTLPGLIAAGTGSGAVSFPVTINDEASNPIDGVEVWISTDSAGASVLAGTLSTDALGLATFMLDAGTYYLWRQKSGYNFTNPVTIVVS